MKSFYKKFFILMIPMALKELISSLVNLVDTIMVGQLGETSIAAVGIANQVYFLFTVFLFGMSCGAGVFASQFWGAGDIKNMRRVLGLNLLLSISLAFIFILGVFTIPKQIFQQFTADPKVMEEGMQYIFIVCIGYLATAVTTCYDMSVCCSENAALPFITRAAGLVINVFFNWIFIFGHLGVPAMGVRGAAIATIIARFSEMAIMLSVIYGKKLIQAAKPKELFHFHRDLVVRFFKAATPVILNEMAWAIGITVYTWVFSKISPEAMVVVTIVQNVERLMLVFFHGGGNAAGIFIGKAVGAKKYKTAYVYGKKFAVLSVGLALILSICFVLARPLILAPYNISPEVYQSAMQLLLIVAFMMNIKSLTFLLIVGVFRNGGDTRAAMFIDIGSVWLIGVPMVALFGLVFHAPLVITYGVMCTEELVKVVVALFRFKSKKWIKNLVSV